MNYLPGITSDSSTSASQETAFSRRHRSERSSKRTLRNSSHNPESSPSFSRLTPDELAKRHVHFGFCEEIHYEKGEVEKVTIDEDYHVGLRRTYSLPVGESAPLLGVLRHQNKRQLSVAKFKMTSVFKWVRLCTPKD